MEASVIQAEGERPGHLEKPEEIAMGMSNPIQMPR